MILIEVRFRKMKFILTISLVCSIKYIAASKLAFTATSPALYNAKENVCNISKDLNKESPSGVFIFEPRSKNKLEKSVSELETLAGPPSENFRRLMIGDWELLCTMNKARVVPSSDRVNFLSIPDWLKSNPLQEKVRQSVEVTQRIRCMEDGDRIDRVDNVIEFTPFSLSDLVDIPLGSLNLNPLEVSQSKVTLAHKAETLSIQPVLRTKISLKSIILTVKGESKYLDPEGADIFGLNVPLGDFLSVGSFDTTYVDDDIRISRGSSGLYDQLRVFLRKDRIHSNNNVTGEEESMVIEESSSNYIDMTEETEGISDQS